MCVCVCVCWPDALSEKGEKKGRSLDNMNFQFGKGQDSSTYINLVVELGLGLGLGLHFSRFACFFANYFASHSPSGAASAASLEVPGGELRLRETSSGAPREAACARYDERSLLLALFK